MANPWEVNYKNITDFTETIWNNAFSGTGMGNPVPYVINDYLESNQILHNGKIIGVIMNRVFGWPLKTICGLLGNMKIESHCNPGLHEFGQGDGGGYGLVQWTPKSNFFSATSWSLRDIGSGSSDLDKKRLLFQQARLVANLDWERSIGQYIQAKSAYPPTYKDFIAAGNQQNTTVSHLVEAFLFNYERPGDPYATIDERRRWGEKFYKELSGILTGEVALSGPVFLSRATSRMNTVRPTCIPQSMYTYRGANKVGGKNSYWDAGGPNPFTGSSIDGNSIPNCTCYAYGRFWEVLDCAKGNRTLDSMVPIEEGGKYPNKPGLPTWDAGSWFPELQGLIGGKNEGEISGRNGISGIGQSPRLGAVMCWSKPGGYGHVEIVEKILDDGTVISSGSGNRMWDKPWFVGEYPQGDFTADGMGAYNFQGFIYPDVVFGDGASYRVTTGVSSITQLSPRKIQINGDTKDFNNADSAFLYVLFGDSQVSEKAGEHHKFNYSTHGKGAINKSIIDNSARQIYEFKNVEYAEVSGEYSLVVERPIDKITTNCISVKLVTDTNRSTSSSGTATIGNTTATVATSNKVVAKLVEIASAEKDYREKISNSQLDDKGANAGSGNWVKYTRDINEAGYAAWNPNPWCVYFTNWCLWMLCGKNRELATKVQCQSSTGTGNCGDIARGYDGHGRLYAEPQVGDQFIIRDSVGDWGHTGFVVKVEGNAYYTIEGNYDDKVAYVKRIVGEDGVRFGRPKYDLIKTVGEVSGTYVVDTDGTFKLGLLESTPCVYVRVDNKWRQAVPFIYTRKGADGKSDAQWRKALPSIKDSIYAVNVYFTTKDFEGYYRVEVSAQTEDCAITTAKEITTKRYKTDTNKFFIQWAKIDKEDLTAKTKRTEWRYVMDTVGRNHVYPSTCGSPAPNNVNTEKVGL